MKRLGGLYEKICDIENVRLAHVRARKGKRHYTEVRMVDADPDRYLLEIQELLRDKRFRNAEYDVFERAEKGKLRQIYRLPYFPDRIIHHCVMNVLEPIWVRIFIRDTYSSMKGRGIHDGARRIQRFLQDEEGTRFCLKFDIHKFYPSIDHSILKLIVRKSIKCRDTLWLLDEIIDSAPGVPIGNYLSQYFANLYLAYFDHWAKEDLGAKYYLRYCDDIVILHSDKAVLHQWLLQIEEYLRDELSLKLKPNWQVFPTRVRGIDFLGYRFFGSYMLIRKRIAHEFKAKMAHIRKHGSRLGYSKVVNTTMSYHGWLIYGDAYNLWKSQIDGPIRKAFVITCRKQGTRNPLKGKAA